MFCEKLKILRSVVLFGCFIALSIESYELYNDYMNYQTVVTVRIGRQTVINFPGVSICESHHFFKVKGNLFGYPILPISKGILIRAKQRDPNILKLINETIDDTEFVRLFYSDNILAKETFGPFDDGFITCNNKATNKPCNPVNHVNGFLHECTTFFNTIDYADGSSKLLSSQKYHIRDNSKDNEMAEIKIAKNQSNYYHTNLVTVIINPANSISVLTKHKLAFRQDLLYFGRRYDVTFRKTTIMKLPKPYKPYCHSYKSNDDVKSYYDCSIRCLHRLIFESLNCSFPQMEVILNEEFSERRICTINDLIEFNMTWFEIVLNKCIHELCLPDCIEEIYEYKIKDVTDSPSFINDKPNNHTIIIQILPQDDDEFTYIHQPKIQRNDLFSKFGGLLSLWLGFSFFSIYKSIEHFIDYYMAKRVR